MRELELAGQVVVFLMKVFNIRIEGRDIVVMVQYAVVLQLLPRFNRELVSLCQQGGE